MMLRKVGYFALVGLFGASLVANAQNRVLVQEVAQDQIQAAPANPTTIQVNTAPPAQAPAQQPVYILQAPAVQAQQQAPTTVEAASVRESKAEGLRRQREDIERQTEEKMIQRIEDDRLNSEKERADRLFNVQATPAPVAPAPVVAPVVVAPAAVQVVEPAPIVVAPATQSVSVEVERSTTVTVDTDKDKPQEKNQFLMGGAFGVGMYPTVSNVSGIYSIGASATLLFPNRLGVEAAFTFSSYDVQVVQPGYWHSPYVRMDQMNITTGLTYRFLSGTVQPVIGGLLSYTYRTFQETYYYGGYGSDVSSKAFDVGLLLGLDFKLSEKFYMGVDFRYMNNLSSRTENPYAYHSSFGKPIESLNYMMFGANCKFAF